MHKKTAPHLRRMLVMDFMIFCRMTCPARLESLCSLLVPAQLDSFSTYENWDEGWVGEFALNILHELAIDVKVMTKANFSTVLASPLPSALLR